MVMEFSCGRYEVVTEVDKILETFEFKMRSDLSYLVGALADGTIYHNKKHYIYRITYYQKSKDYLSKSIESRIIALFGKPGHYYYDKRKGVNYYEVTSKRIYQIMQKIAHPFKNTEAQTIPEWILKGSEEVHRAFVRGFFDAEGWYHMDQKKFDYRVRFGQANYKILKGIQDILHREGFRCSAILGPYQSKPNAKPYYELHIHGRDQLIRFHKLIKPNHPHKQLQL
jgi:intein/homing endonuclease